VEERTYTGGFIDKNSKQSSLACLARASITFIMNKLDTHTRVQIVEALVEGVGINATCRIVGVARNTVLKLLV